VFYFWGTTEKLLQIKICGPGQEFATCQVAGVDPTIAIDLIAILEDSPQYTPFVKTVLNQGKN
jgi:hypothetical protein